MDDVNASRFRPVKSRRLFEEISEQVRDQIASGTLLPGDKLPAERELALQFGVSRAAVREALRSLEFAGLIRQHKGVKGGSFILGSEMGLVNSFDVMMSVGGLSFDELNQVRIEILDIVTRLAVHNHREVHLKALEKDVKRTEAHLRASEIASDPAITQNFYALLAEATGNRLLVAIVKALSQFLYKALSPPYPPVSLDLVVVRTQFLRSLALRDETRARAIMRDFLVRLHGYIMDNQP